MHVTIWAVGRLRDPPVAALCDAYLKRLGRHLKVALREVRSEQEVLRRVPAHAHLVGLDAGGTQHTSEAFARWLQARLTDPAPLQLVIGGADGLGEALRARAAERLSLGPMTLPHRLARVVLVEQLYRASTILRGEPYHR